MKLVKLRVFAATVSAVLVPSICTCSELQKEDKYSAKALVYFSNYIDNSDNIESTTTSTTNTTTTVSTTTTTTTVVTTTEPIDIYKHIRNLESLKNNDLAIEDLDLFINKYAGYTKLSYDEALDIINNNIDTIENDYQSIRGGIMCTLFSYSNDNGLLSVYTNDKEIRPEMTCEEKEKIMIEFSDNLCMCNDDKYIVLAAFREETGRGISERCVYDNNYGGIRIYGEAGCNGEYGMYSTPEFGMYREVKLIYNKLVSIRSNGASDINSVIYSFACRYNPDYADHYAGKISGWVSNVQSEYGDFTSIDSYQKVYSK